MTKQDVNCGDRMLKDGIRKEPVPEDFGLNSDAIQRTEADWAEYACARNKAEMTFFRILSLSALAGFIAGCVICVWCLYDDDGLGAFVMAPCGGFFGAIAGMLVGCVPAKVMSLLTPKVVLSQELRQRHDNLEAFRTAATKWSEYQKRCQIEFWTKMDGWTFEREIAQLFQSHGFDAEVTKGSGDGGVDIFLRKGSALQVVQCKQHSAAVPPSVIRDLYGVLMHHKADKAILVSTSGFTSAAIQFASGKPIHLLGLDEILAMARESQESRVRTLAVPLASGKLYD